MPGPSATGPNTQECLRNRQVSLCQILHLTEENIRFVLLAIFLYIYLCIGAFIFQAIEESAETQMRLNYEILFNDFMHNLTLLNEEVTKSNQETEEHSFESRNRNDLTFPNTNNVITENDVFQLLYAYGNATKAGAFSRRRWDWVGSFHFAWTIVSTIGE